MMPAARAVLAVGALGALLALVLGPWAMAALLGDDYRVSGRTLAALTLAATGLAFLTLTSALCQALTLHSIVVGGWLVSVVVAVLLLQFPWTLESRAVLALIVGPLAGIVIQLLSLRHATRTQNPLIPLSRREHIMRLLPVNHESALVDDNPWPHVSVCLATYNGARYIEDQLRSILEQLATTDEVVLVDDGSTDDTVARVRALADERVRVIEHPQNRGYVPTFEDTLRHARGEILLLSDQDDVWTPGRVAAMAAALHDVDVVATNLATLNGPERIKGPYGQRDWNLRAESSGRPVRNIIATLAGNRPYYGCAMGLRRTALTTILPFPPLLTESHDLWIALYGNMAGSIRHLELRSVRRRFHDDNASPDRPRGPVPVLRSRLMLARAVVELWRRTRA
jgi:hypothetical protein